MIFLPDYGLTPSALAAAIGVSRQSTHELLKCERAVTPLMVLRLARLFGATHPNFGSMHKQAWDIWHWERAHRCDLVRIQPMPMTA